MSQILKKLETIEEAPRTKLEVVKPVAQPIPATSKSPNKKILAIILAIILVVLITGTLMKYISTSDTPLQASRSSTTSENANQYHTQLLDHINKKQFKEGLNYLNANKDQFAKDNIEAINLMGIILRNTQQYEETVSLYTEAITKWPESATLFNNRGVAFLAMKDPTKAISDFQNALKFKQEYPEAYLNMGIAHELANNWGQAYHYYSSYLQRADGERSIQKTLKDRLKKIVPMVFYEKKIKDVKENELVE